MAQSFVGTAGVNYAKVVSGDGATVREVLISCNDLATVTRAIQFLVVSAGAAAPTGGGHVLMTPLMSAGSGSSGPHTVTVRTSGDIYIKRADSVDSTYAVTIP